MQATVVLPVHSSAYVPSEPAERVAWLEAHGVPKATVDVKVTAELAAWGRCGIVPELDGTVRLTGRSHDELVTESALRAIAASRLATGACDVRLTDADVVSVASLVEADRAERKRASDETAAREKADHLHRVEQERARGIEAALWQSPTGEWLSAQPRNSRYRDDLLKEALGADVYERAEVEAQRRNEIRAAERAQYTAAIREIASTIDELARPAAEDYDVERAVLDRLAKDLAEAASDAAEGYAIDTRAWAEPEERAAPRPDAFALRDRVVAAVASANERLPAAVGKWAASRIVRVDVCQHEGQHHNVTAVLATLRTPFAVREVMWATESMACRHDDDNDS